MWCNFTKHIFNNSNTIKLLNNDFTNEIKKIRNLILNLKSIPFTIDSINIDDSKINNLKKSKFVDDKLSWENLNYSVKISFNNINIYIKTTKHKFNNIYKRLDIFIKVTSYITKNIKNNLDIYLILSDLKKKLDFTKIIDAEHVNSGYYNPNSNEIFIWREEEFEKVCFHELMHATGQDHYTENINYITNIKGPQSYYESITDFKAIIYNIIYLSIITKIKIKSLLKHELFFIYNQAKLINKHLNIFQKQNTPVYSYFILKYYIFNYFNGNNFDVKLFNDLLYKNKGFNKLIILIKNNKLINNDYVDFNSARMTYLELI